MKADIQTFLVGVWVLFSAVASSADDFRLEKSELVYRASHLLKRVEGRSHEAKGVVRCAKAARDCDFLVASPLRSFDSGNSNRDSHMLETTRGAAYPLVQVSGKVAEMGAAKSEVAFDVDFAGKRHRYPAVPVEMTAESAGAIHVRSTLPIQLSAHDVDRPSLLGAAIKNDVPVVVDLVFRKAP